MDFQDKTDENGEVIRNIARLVAKGYPQLQGIDFDKTFPPVTCLESVRLLLDISCHLHFIRVGTSLTEMTMVWTDVILLTFEHMGGSFLLENSVTLLLPRADKGI